ncbi:hypothetical protein J2Z21_003445 [Streptomyces griseochromogenes]|uniref:Integral membrane protein n=1 Tax=Streptomyces griseochromogenes TaxID=68214 RepID=A0ABS4LTN5_9ACTN|nr:hypothetical protein [Streptomyces griseochromogenes]MBP2050506.1 hypothetical protein [Streptomyces griseochromogenes]
MFQRPGRRRGAAAALWAVAVLLLGACGKQVGGATGGASPASWTTVEPSYVTGARLGADGRTLSLDTLVPEGGRSCVKDLRAEYRERVNGAVWVQVTYATHYGIKVAGCGGKEKPATARVRLPEPLGKEDLIVDHYTHFTRDRAKPPALRLCGKLGCDPAPTGCTPDSYDQALMAVDAPKHAYRDSERCDGRWLVLDFSWRTGPACDDTSNPACSSALGDRWFYRAGKSGWVPVFGGVRGGCKDVQRKEPRFPTALCESLAPLPARLHPAYPPPSASPSGHRGAQDARSRTGR